MHRKKLQMGDSLFVGAVNELGKYLKNPGPHMVVYDEAHRLKSEVTQRHIEFKKISTKRRIFLTGTPSPNNLVEFYNLIHLANPSLLGTKDEFDAE